MISPLVMACKVYVTPIRVKKSNHYPVCTPESGTSNPDPDLKSLGNRKQSNVCFLYLSYILESCRIVIGLFVLGDWSDVHWLK